MSPPPSGALPPRPATVTQKRNLTGGLGPTKPTSLESFCHPAQTWDGVGQDLTTKGTLESPVISNMPTKVTQSNVTSGNGKHV